MGDRANHVKCVVCCDAFEARDLEQANESHGLFQDGPLSHNLKVSVELTVDQVLWLNELVRTANRVAVTDTDETTSREVLEELVRVYTVS